VRPRTQTVDGVSATGNWFDHVAEAYDGSLPRHVQEHYLRKRVRLLRGIFSGKNVLDVGCGTGALVAAMRRAGVPATGCDRSGGMLAVMRRLGRGTAAQADCTRLPFRSRAFDGAVCVAMLHHLGEADAAGAVREMVRVTGPGGRIVVWDHNPLNPYWPFLMRRVPQDTGSERLWRASEVVRLLRGFGVRECRVMRMGLVPDFASPSWLPVFALAERILESLPLVRRLAAHNVVVARKSATPGTSDNG